MTEASADHSATAESAATASATSEQRAPRLKSLAHVDTVAVLAGLSVWAAADMWHASTGLLIAAAVAVGSALYVGYLLTALIHEWGHYTGARWSGAQTQLVRRKGFRLFRFSFDFDANTTAQFRAMSYGGNLAHWGVVVLLYLSLPMTSPGQAALVAASFAFALGASVFELSVISAVQRGAQPEAALRERADVQTVQRGRWVTWGSGVLVFLALA